MAQVGDCNQRCFKNICCRNFSKFNVFSLDYSLGIIFVLQHYNYNGWKPQTRPTMILYFLLSMLNLMKALDERTDSVNGDVFSMMLKLLI